MLSDHAGSLADEEDWSRPHTQSGRSLTAFGMRSPGSEIPNEHHRLDHRGDHLDRRAFWPARVADRKGHSFFGYFVFSLFFFPLALLMAYLAQDRSRAKSGLALNPARGVQLSHRRLPLPAGDQTSTADNQVPAW